jgi:hypothetical protein
LKSIISISNINIGENYAEALYPESKNDFISKYSITLKEASKTLILD